MKPSATVVVTTWNNEDSIKNCIDSVLDQTYDNYDVYVVEAYSQDNTYEILKDYGNQIELDQVSGWAPAAFNWAIDRIDSDLVAFTDADCVVDSTWLENLVVGFDSEEIVGVAGFCGSGEPKNIIENVIGIELEHRFNHFPEFIARAPTMNLAVRTEALKKEPFDERLRVAFETDLGYRLQKHGKIRYKPDAVIKHQHRGSWFKLFSQQLNYGIYQFAVSMRHRGHAVGDHLSSLYMYMQIPAAYLTVLFMLLSVVWTPFIFLSTLGVLGLLATFILKSRKLDIPEGYLKYFMVFFAVRLAGWCVGLPKGVIKYVTGETR